MCLPTESFGNDRTYRFRKPLTVVEEARQAIAKMHEWDVFLHELAEPSNEALAATNPEYGSEHGCLYRSESGAVHGVFESESDAASDSSGFDVAQ